MKAVAAILPTLSIICRIIPTASSFAAQSHRRSVDDCSASSRRGCRLRSPSFAAYAAAADPGPERGAATPLSRHEYGDDDDDDDEAGIPRRPWATRALLFSSFDDGVSSNDAARSFLRHSLADALLRERADAIEEDVRSSATFSPCNGPDADAICDLERADRMRERGRGLVVDAGGGGGAGLRKGSVDRWSTEALRLLLGGGGTGTDPGGRREEEPRARVLYVPTAMYAPDPRSSSTPGRQRQRARADGKKRRDKLLRLVEDLLTIDDDEDDDDDHRDDDRRRRRIGVLSTTLDLDDGSLKHNFGSDDASLFPRDGSAALATWRPHLVYVEGGNTFWLRHCMGKGPGPGGGYVGLVRDACAGPRGFAVYLGKSAGAIVAGRDVSTATWKGWDDPSVVPGRRMGGASDDDWSDLPGLDLAGGRSFFPHMSDEWADTVRERTREMTTDDDAEDEGLVCLGERDALCVMGDERLLIMTSGTEPVN